MHDKPTDGQSLRAVVGLLQTMAYNLLKCKANLFTTHQQEDYRAHGYQRGICNRHAVFSVVIYMLCASLVGRLWRSEERRVGNEYRTRGARFHNEKCKE